MTFPGRLGTARLLLSLDPPEWYLRHSCAVADVAAFLARRAMVAGSRLDVAAVEAASLLHDVDKLASARAPARLRHGEGSAAWLADRGWPELGPLVRDHPVTRLAEDDADSWALTASLEVRIVAYADKRAGQRLEAMDRRFASWRRRYPDGPGEHVTRGADTHGGSRRGDETGGGATGDGGDGDAPRGSGWDDEVAARVVARALALELGVCAAAGLAPGAVRRLRWSRRALREAAS